MTGETNCVKRLKAQVEFFEQRQEGEREYRKLGLAEDNETASIWRERTLAEVNAALVAIINETEAAERRLAMH